MRDHNKALFARAPLLPLYDAAGVEKKKVKVVFNRLPVESDMGKVSTRAYGYINGDAEIVKDDFVKIDGITYRIQECHQSDAGDGDSKLWTVEFRKTVK